MIRSLVCSDLAKRDSVKFFIAHNSQGILFAERNPTNLKIAKKVREAVKYDSNKSIEDLFNKFAREAKLASAKKGYIAPKSFYDEYEHTISDIGSDRGKYKICGEGDMIAFSSRTSERMDGSYEFADVYSSTAFHAKYIIIGTADPQTEREFLVTLQCPEYKDPSYRKQMIKDGLAAPEDFVEASEYHKSFCDAGLYAAVNEKTEGAVTYKILDGASRTQPDFDEYSSYKGVAVPFKDTVKLSHFTYASTGEIIKNTAVDSNCVVCGYPDLKSKGQAVVNTQSGFVSHGIMSNHPSANKAADYNNTVYDGKFYCITGVYHNGQLLPAVDPEYFDKTDLEHTALMGSERAAVVDKSSGHFAYCDREQILEICDGRSVSDFLENDDNKPILKESQRLGKAKRDCPDILSEEMQADKQYC